MGPTRELGYAVLSSDQDDGRIGVSVRQRTVNLRGETIEVALPPLAEGEHIAFVSNGQGLSTELRLGNASRTRAHGTIEVRRPDGELARETILR